MTYKFNYDKNVVMDNDEMETKKTTALTTVLTSLRKSTNYSIQISGYTRMGDGILSAPRFCNTEEDGNKFKFLILLFFTFS